MSPIIHTKESVVHTRMNTTNLMAPLHSDSNQ